jgi:hypothetical protein
LSLQLGRELGGRMSLHGIREVGPLDRDGDVAAAVDEGRPFGRKVIVDETVIVLAGIAWPIEWS